MQVIIYNQDNGIPAIVVPTPECLETYTILEIAIKDVPVGKPFKFINSTDLPQDWPQETWDVDMTNSDGVGGDSNEFPKEKA
jgi:hypothetical protein